MILQQQNPGPTPEGHRAPIPRLSRTRSVDTQTPAADDSSDNGSRSESRSHSVSPTTFPMDGSRPSSRSSSTGNGEVKIEKGGCCPYAFLELVKGPLLLLISSQSSLMVDSY